ncbi:MAG: c-type cytochrome [Deltaproteobacteria bacterium]|nr:c-type cytochrome [Deltaproteobacteria bacterium]
MGKALALIISCSAMILTLTARPLVRAEGLTPGPATYESACAPCHGRLGDGKGPVATNLEPAPRDFTRGVFKYRSTPSGKLPTDNDLMRTIWRGVPGTAMPGWQGTLPESDIRAVAQYVKTFSPKFARRGPPTEVEPPAVADPGPRNREEGRRYYLLFRCWECHGIHGSGNGPSAMTLKDDWGHPIRPANFTRGVFRAGAMPADLFRTLATGLSGTPMPAYREAMVVGREALGDMTTLAEHVDSSTLAALRAFVDTLPTQEQLDGLEPEAKRRLGDTRLWGLVHYVRSLARPGAWDDLFRSNAGRY